MANRCFHLPSDVLKEIAKKLFWWQFPEQALENPIRFVCQVMTLGPWDDVLVVRKELGGELFRTALEKAPAGIFDARSWNYWHLVFGVSPIPPLPTRPFV